MKDMFQEPVFKVLKKSLDASTLRLRATAQNIANVDTPKYKKAFVTFESELQNALRDVSGLKGVTTHKNHLPIGDRASLDDVHGRVLLENNFKNRVDSNNIDIEEEMANLSKNNIMYNMYAQFLSTKYRMYANVIGERV